MFLEVQSVPGWWRWNLPDGQVDWKRWSGTTYLRRRHSFIHSFINLPAPSFQIALPTYLPTRSFINPPFIHPSNHSTLKISHSSQAETYILHGFNTEPSSPTEKENLFHPLGRKEINPPWITFYAQSLTLVHAMWCTQTTSPFYLTYLT